MLQSLRIKNLALIDDLTWELEPGLNILTGETGAGKSILIDAFNLLLGERADKSLIRDGESQCVVEGVINGVAFLNETLEEFGIEKSEENEIFLKRSFNLQGQNKQFINGSPTTLKILKTIGDQLVDMHGPHDHQSLLSRESQLLALDAFSELDDMRAKHSQLYRQWTTDQKELETYLHSDEGEVMQRLDFLEHQITEIENAELKKGEEDQLVQDYQIANSAKQLKEFAFQASNLLEEGEENVVSLLAQVQRILQEWEKIDPNAEKLSQSNASIVDQLHDLQQDIQKLSNRTDIDEEQLYEMEQRLNLIQDLKRKYGRSFDEISEKLEQFKNQRDAFKGREDRIKNLEKILSEMEAKLKKIAGQLSKERDKFAPKLANAVTKQLKSLGFKQSLFKVEVDKSAHLKSEGQDLVEFLFAPNPGESKRPLRSIASSGEMARVMLALKTVLAAKDKIPVLIFDEVDANVGGETAVSVGKRLRKLGEAHQVLCITHLPQVAAAGHAHFSVEKKVIQKRTKTALTHLSEETRREELARMLGGGNDSSRELAETLLESYS